MPELDEIEDPAVIRNYLVWVRPAEGEEWSTMRDSAYRGQTFKPNRLCTVVTQSDNRSFHAGWSQVREEHDYGSEGKPHVVCRGTLDSEQYAGRYDLPPWWLGALEFAERVVQQQQQAQETADG